MLLKNQVIKWGNGSEKSHRFAPTHVRSIQIKINIGTEMRIFGGLLIVTLLLAVFLGFVSAGMKSPNDQWMCGMLQNVAAELLGLGLGIFLPALIATILAKNKFKKLAPDLVKLISQLRKDGTISPEAARACVVCAVNIFSESIFELSKSEITKQFGDTECPVCGLPAEESLTDQKHCKFCRLPKHVWNLSTEEGGQE